VTYGAAEARNQAHRKVRPMPKPTTECVRETEVTARARLTSELAKRQLKSDSSAATLDLPGSVMFNDPNAELRPTGQIGPPALFPPSRSR